MLAKIALYSLDDFYAQAESQDGSGEPMIMVSRHLSPETPNSAVETMRRLEGIVASAMDGIITIDSAQHIILFNPAAERIFGLKAEDAIGQPIERLIPDRHRMDHAAHIHRFSETGVTTRQMGSLGAISGLRIGGEEFPLEASISQIDVGGERLSTVILRDITERKAAEDALADSQRRMEGVVNSAMDALITADEQQRIILFNPAAERMFGVAAKEAIGSPIERFMPERFREGHSEHIARFKETGITNRRMGALGAISGLRSSGEEFPIEASISQIAVGGVQIATVILRDITERKANEEALQLLAREVDHRAKNALAVVQALVSLTQAATKEEFVIAVRGRVAALGRAHSLLAQNKWEGADLAQIVTDETGAYVRPGQINIESPPILIGPKGVQPISMLIHELATNAVKYGALSAREGRVDIRLTILPSHELEICWVESGGPPVTCPETTGFGSTLVNQVVTRQLGGWLDIGWHRRGLRLIATLPASVYRLETSAVAHPANKAPAYGHVAVSGQRLLIVEDESLIGMELSRELTSLGWGILGPATTMQEARTILGTPPLPYAAILDVNLGGDLVYPLAEELRDLGIPFIFCTGYEHLDQRWRYPDSPIVRKPVNMFALSSELEKLLPAA